jgi:hypothetical protein
MSVTGADAGPSDRRRHLDRPSRRLEQHPHRRRRLSQFCQQRLARRGLLLLGQVAADRRRHYLQRSALHLADVLLIERHDRGFLDRLDALGYLGLRPRFSAHAGTLRRLGQQRLGEQLLERLPAPVVHLLRHLRVIRRIGRTPAVLQLLHRDHAVADPCCRLVAAGLL